jgi:hypothetical protein
MLETAIALAFGHFLADFTLQTDWMVRRKREPMILLAHVGVVTAVTWVALGFSLSPLLLLMIAATHLPTLFGCSLAVRCSFVRGSPTRRA